MHTDTCVKDFRFIAIIIIIITIIIIIYLIILILTSRGRVAIFLAPFPLHPFHKICIS